MKYIYLQLFKTYVIHMHEHTCIHMHVHTYSLKRSNAHVKTLAYALTLVHIFIHTHSCTDAYTQYSIDWPHAAFRAKGYKSY